MMKPLYSTGSGTFSAGALWTKPKAEISADEYRDFYRSAAGQL